MMDEVNWRGGKERDVEFWSEEYYTNGILILISYSPRILDRYSCTEYRVINRIFHAIKHRMIKYFCVRVCGRCRKWRWFWYWYIWMSRNMLLLITLFKAKTKSLILYFIFLQILECWHFFEKQSIEKKPMILHKSRCLDWIELHRRTKWDVDVRRRRWSNDVGHLVRRNVDMARNGQLVSESPL